MQSAILAVVLLCMGLLTDKALHTNAANPNADAELITLKDNGVAKLFDEKSPCPHLARIIILLKKFAIIY